MVKDKSVSDQYIAFDDLVPTLEYLQSKGYRLVICSNAIQPLKIRLILENNKLTAFFDPIIISGEVNCRKPDPKIIQLIKSKFPGVKDYEYVIIGDLIDRDILCGLKSNIRTIWFTNEILDPKQCFKKLPNIKPDFIFAHYLQLKSLIDILDKDALFISSQSSEFQDNYRNADNFKLLPSNKLQRVAYYFNKKKIADLSRIQMITSNDKILFIPLLIDCPLELQGPFNALIHKATDLLLDDTIMKKDNKYSMLLEYNAKNEGKMAFIDPIKNFKFSLDRMLTNSTFDNVFRSNPFVELFKKFNKNLKIPTWTSELNNNPESTNSKIKLWMQANNVSFPLFLKPYISCQSNESHLLSIAMSDKGLLELLKDKNYKGQTLTFQIFVPHYNTIYKVYTIGEYMTILIKKSLPSKLNFADYYFFDSQKPFPLELIQNLQTVDKLDRQFMSECCAIIQKAIWLTMLGIDIIIDEVSDEYYLIDFNYLSSYKHEKNLNSLITKHILKCIQEQCHILS